MDFRYASLDLDCLKLLVVAVLGFLQFGFGIILTGYLFPNILRIFSQYFPYLETSLLAHLCTFFEKHLAD